MVSLQFANQFEYFLFTKTHFSGLSAHIYLILPSVFLIFYELFLLSARRVMTWPNVTAVHCRTLQYKHTAHLCDVCRDVSDRLHVDLRGDTLRVQAVTLIPLHGILPTGQTQYTHFKWYNEVWKPIVANPQPQVKRIQSYSFPSLKSRLQSVISYIKWWTRAQLTRYVKAKYVNMWSVFAVLSSYRYHSNRMNGLLQGSTYWIITNLYATAGASHSLLTWQLE